MRTAMLIVFGVIPAGFLAWLAAVLAFGGGEVLIFGGQWYGLLLVLWGIAGIWGGIALLRAAIGHPVQRIWRGLVVGIIAILPVLYLVATYRWPDSKVVWILVVLSPLVVAIYLLYEWKRGQ